MSKENIIYGYHACKEYIGKKIEYINKVLIQSNNLKRYSDIVYNLRNKGVRVDVRDKMVMDKITNGANHQGIVIYTVPIVYYDVYKMIEEAGKDPIFVLLDRIEDPQNLGGIIRTAAASNVNGIIINERRCVQITPAVIKVSSGGLASVKISKVNNIKNILPELKERGISIVVTVVRKGQLWTEVDYTKGVAFIFGGESKGVRRILIEKADYKVSIPLSEKMESLNVSVACGIMIYEAIRQRMELKKQKM